MRSDRLQYVFIVPMVDCKVGYKKAGSKDIQGLDKGCFGLFVVNRRMRIQAGKDDPRLNLYPVVDHILAHLNAASGGKVDTKTIETGSDGKSTGTKKVSSKEVVKKISSKEVVKKTDSKGKVTSDGTKTSDSKRKIMTADGTMRVDSKGKVSKVAKSESSGRIKKDGKPEVSEKVAEKELEKKVETEGRGSVGEKKEEKEVRERREEGRGEGRKEGKERS